MQYVETILIKNDQPLNLQRFKDYEIVIEQSTRPSVIFKNQKVLELVKTLEMSYLTVNIAEALKEPVSTWIQGDGICLNIYHNSFKGYLDLYTKLSMRGHFYLC